MNHYLNNDYLYQLMMFEIVLVGKSGLTFNPKSINTSTIKNTPGLLSSEATYKSVVCYFMVNLPGLNDFGHPILFLIVGG